MFKEYIKQIFEEGLGYSLYMPLERFIKKNFSGGFRTILNFLLKLIYILIIIYCLYILFFYGYPFK